MRKSYITVYDLQMRRVAELENAFTVGYSTPMNGLWTASFSLPADDEKNAECRPLYFVELWDGDERLDLFRILPNTTKRDSSGAVITYQCEHVLATMLDDVLFQYHTVGNLGVYTTDVLSYILQRQMTPRWQLADVQFGRQFEYNWENENLLGALFSVPKPFAEEYQWSWDTTVYPWRLSLVRPSQQVQAYIRYGVNMQGITKVEDPSNLITKLYGLGYGEGVNQLTFAEINGGLPYIEAEPEYIARYGRITSVFVDQRIEYPETLLGQCRAMLDQAKIPRISYTVDATELYQLTNDPIDKFQTGAVVRVLDKELGIDVTTRVLNRSKQDFLGQPGAVTLEIANKSQDIAGTIAELRNRQYANEVYAQGATNLDTRDFADNCDPQHPAVLRFWIPEETVRINKVRLSFETEPFRAYSRAIEGGGAVSTTTEAGGGAATTTESGGATVAPTKTIAGHSSLEGGATYDDQDRIITGLITLDHNSGNVPMVRDLPFEDSLRVTLPGGSHSHDVSPSGSHNHGGAAGSHNHGNPDNLNASPTINSDGSHTHGISGGEHSHGVTIEHGHTTAYHTHLIDHSHEIEIPNHKHELNLPNHTHEINIPNHTHEIEYGIYQGPRPDNVSIKVDGTEISAGGTSGSDIDLIPYLSKDGAGKVQRGTWHTIQIAPDKLGRVTANVVTQLFVQSRGGGNY